MERRTVFLHCGWRTASTYLWSRFRALDETVAYYEPLHEFLARLTPDGSDPNAAWDAGKRGHPGEDRPFAEFVPLAVSGRVANYDTAFATSCYFLAPEDGNPPLEAYLRTLEQHARTQHRSAVFGFCRSLGRAAWLKQRFPDALNIVLTRSPFDHWHSSLSQFTRHRIPYFLQMPVQIACENHSRAAELTTLARRFGLPDGRRPLPSGVYGAIVQRLPIEALLSIFIEVNALAYAHALTFADIVLSIDEFASDAAYRDQTIDRIESESGLRISPGDIGLTRYSSQQGDPFADLDLRRISALRESKGPVARSEDAVSLYRRMLKSDIARARKQEG